MGRAPLFLFVLCLVGCAPEIGDPCETSVDCSPAGDRLCDISQPNGYCTIHNCEPDTCPEESVCVVYETSPSALEACVDPHGASPYQRSFCMLVCEEDSDCRDEEGYRCLDVRETSQWRAVIVPSEEQREDPPTKICTRPYDGNPVPGDRSTDVCTESSPPPSVREGAGGAPSGPTGEGGAGGA